jgi:hypothetical protein
MLRFSPGVAQGCHELLTLVKKHSYPPQYILQAFAHVGAIPSDRIFATAQALDWICVDEHGHLAPTVSGERLLASSSYAQLLRLMLLDYIDIERPSWVQNAPSGRAKVLGFAGAEVAQLFVEANLADGVDDETVTFWDTLAARARGQKDARLNQIGRQGERLSLFYEHRRTEHEARWISIESNEDGYDILSVLDKEDTRKLSIEVKASTLGNFGFFHLSANEWERAEEANHHAFHLWDISKSPARLSVVSVPMMAQHVPANAGDGSWEIVRVPLAAFAYIAIPDFGTLV